MLNYWFLMQIHLLSLTTPPPLEDLLQVHSRWAPVFDRVLRAWPGWGCTTAQFSSVYQQQQQWRIPKPWRWTCAVLMSCALSKGLNDTSASLLAVHLHPISHLSPTLIFLPFFPCHISCCFLLSSLLELPFHLHPTLLVLLFPPVLTPALLPRRSGLWHLEAQGK